MKNVITICLVFVLAIFIILMNGCSSKKEYIELEKETFNSIQISELTEIDIVRGNDPNTWQGKYRFIFPVSDSEKIQIICNCIREANSIDYYTMGNNILFKTKKKIYYMGIGINYGTKVVYGNYWESNLLYDYFLKWGLEPPKAEVESNLPQQHIFENGFPIPGPNN